MIAIWLRGLIGHDPNSLVPIFPERPSPPVTPSPALDALWRSAAAKDNSMAVNALSLLSSLLSALENPEDAVLIEAAGHFLNTVATHNKEHLGATASSALAQIGTDIQSAPAVAAALTGSGLQPQATS